MEMRIEAENIGRIVDYLTRELAKQHTWMAYNTHSTSLDEQEIYCFPCKDDAISFCKDNISDYDNFRVVPAEAVLFAINSLQALRSASEIQLADTYINMREAIYNYEKQRTQDNHFLTIKTNIMNQKNFDYLKDQVKFTGFGDSLEDALAEKIGQQAPEFMLIHQRDFGKDFITAALHFKKPENSDVYFFNSYDLIVKQEKADDVVKQTFYVGKENNFTLKEAYNLLAGRAVYKELNKLEKTGEGEQVQYRPTDEKYKAWVQLDFKNTEANGNFKMKYFHENYGFDLSAKLAEYPIKELGSDEERKNLVQSLEKGNRQSVSFIRDGKEHKQSIEANPQYKSITIYDSNNKRIRTSQRQEENGTQQTQEKTKKEKQEQATDDSEDGPKHETKKSRNKKQRIS